MFGGIIVGAKAREVKFPDAHVTDTVQACITALSFSGCGGLFVRRTALPAANTFDARRLEDAYALWNYYPVGFFASRCLEHTLKTTSRVVVIQTRFAPTTNNWSNTSPSQSNLRVPHYYPESVFDRLVSSLVNVWRKPLPFSIRLQITRRLMSIFRLQAASYADPALHDLLRENYSDEIVRAYLKHIKAMHLDGVWGPRVWTFRKIMFSLPLKLFHTNRHWEKLTRT
jgi:hypothetical protein